MTQELTRRRDRDCASLAAGSTDSVTVWFSSSDRQPIFSPATDNPPRTTDILVFPARCKKLGNWLHRAAWIPSKSPDFPHFPPNPTCVLPLLLWPSPTTQPNFQRSRINDILHSI